MTCSERRVLLREVARRTTVSISVGCLIPGVLFYSLFIVGGVWPAMGAALAWTYGALIWRRATHRPVSGLLALAAGVLTLRTIVSIAAQSPFLYFLQPVLTDVAIGFAFLMTLLSTKPIIARMAPDFYPLDDEVAARPGVRRLFAGLTALWGTVLILKGSIMLWVLTSSSTDTYVLVRGLTVPPTNVLTIATTIALALWVARREGLLNPAPVARPEPLPVA